MSHFCINFVLKFKICFELVLFSVVHFISKQRNAKCLIFVEMSRPQISIMTLYLVTIATHRLEFYSSHYRVNEEQFRLQIDWKNKNKLTNKNGEPFLWKYGAKRGVVDCRSMPNLFSMLELRESLKSEE